jgi:hypothetical protein
MLVLTKVSQDLYVLHGQFSQITATNKSRRRLMDNALDADEIQTPGALAAAGGIVSNGKDMWVPDGGNISNGFYTATRLATGKERSAGNDNVKFSHPSPETAVSSRNKTPVGNFALRLNHSSLKIEHGRVLAVQPDFLNPRFTPTSQNRRNDDDRAVPLQITVPTAFLQQRVHRQKIWFVQQALAPGYQNKNRDEEKAAQLVQQPAYTPGT